MDENARGLARELLAWYQALGADEALQDIPIDWLARGDVGPGQGFAAQSSGAPSTENGAREPDQPVARPEAGGVRAPTRGGPPPQPAVAPARQFHAAAPDESVAVAREAARSAPTIEALGEALAKFDGCALKATAKNLCFYRGAAKARLMLIGEAPGREEDLEGRPFVGRAGKLLDKMLAGIGMTEADCHITNTVYWRPPGNRTPSPIEAQSCRPFLERQIELVDPDIIVALGGAAAKNLLGAEEGIMRLRGKWREIDFGGRTRRVMATLHPAYLLRTPAQKRLAWRDMLAIAAALEHGE